MNSEAKLPSAEPVAEEVECVVCGARFVDYDDDDLCPVCEMNEQEQLEWERDRD